MIPYDYLSSEIRRCIERIPPQELEQVNEIRVRLGKPLALTLCNGIKYVSCSGKLLFMPDNEAYIADIDDMKQIFEAVCRYSIHSFAYEISNGFITVGGGHRIGICGTAVLKNGRVENIKNISGFNIRIARQVKGSAEALINRVFSCGLKSVLIAGEPASGKTTVLRDLCRVLGKRYRVSVIDERGEIAATSCGAAQNDVGANSDVFNGFTKQSGIETAVRVMSPQIIVCDEIGSRDDYSALEYAQTCGVRVAASVHAADMSDIVKKLSFYRMFDYVVFLIGSARPCEISEIIRTDEYDKGIGNCVDNFCVGNDGKLLCGKADRTVDISEKDKYYACGNGNTSQIQIGYRL